MQRTSLEHTPGDLNTDLNDIPIVCGDSGWRQAGGKRQGVTRPNIRTLGYKSEKFKFHWLKSKGQEEGL